MNKSNAEFAETTFGDGNIVPVTTTEPTAIAVATEQKNEVNVELFDFDINQEVEELFGSLDQSNQEKIELTTTYLNFEEGLVEPTQRLIFRGIQFLETVSKATGEIERKPAAFFVNANKEMFYSFATVLVGAVQLIKAPSPVEIVYLGPKKSKTGNKFHNFKVSILRPVQSLKA